MQTLTVVQSSLVVAGLVRSSGSQVVNKLPLSTWAHTLEPLEQRAQTVRFFFFQPSPLSSNSASCSQILLSAAATTCTACSGASQTFRWVNCRTGAARGPSGSTQVAVVLRTSGGVLLLTRLSGEEEGIGWIGCVGSGGEGRWEKVVWGQEGRRRRQLASSTT